MGFLKPTAPPYDPLEWEKMPFRDRARLSSQAWALQGYGTPLAIYLLYAVKVALYVAGWRFLCSFTPGLGWLEPVAFEKAILWNLLFESMGLGCGSGPLTGRFYPPFGGFLYFLRPGTTKHALVSGLGMRRTTLDALLYLAWMVAVVFALVSVEPSRPVLAVIAALLVVLGITDKTIFLAARAEHFWTTLVVFVLTPDWVPGAKAVMLALWFWAGVSKLNHHFASVVCVMVSNSPFTRFEWLRKLFYKKYPDDLTPSVLAVIAEGGIVLEFAVPILLCLGDGGTLTLVGLVCMVFLHAYITSNVPMGVPIEWNFMMVYSAFFLFWKNAAVRVWDMPLPVAAFLILMLVAVPLLGNLFPSKISFLMAMRYYAGNWAYSVWLFRGESFRKLEKLKKSSPWIIDQLHKVGYDRPAAVAVLSKLMAFRLMHLHGRALPPLVAKAVDRFEDYVWVDGEALCGLVLGYNFGDGHLHDETLLAAVQAQCGFDDGELRCIFVEAQPLGGKSLHYRIADAKTGARDEGHVKVADLVGQAPWG